MKWDHDKGNINTNNNPSSDLLDSSTYDITRKHLKFKFKNIVEDRATSTPPPPQVASSASMAAGGSAAAVAASNSSSSQPMASISSNQSAAAAAASAAAASAASSHGGRRMNRKKELLNQVYIFSLIYDNVHLEVPVCSRVVGSASQFRTSY